MKEFHSFRVHERATGARLVIVGVFLLLVGAFFRTQVLDYDRFRLRAESNRLRPVPLQPGSRHDLRSPGADHRGDGSRLFGRLAGVIERFNTPGPGPVQQDRAARFGRGRDGAEPLSGGSLSASAGPGQCHSGAGIAAGRAPRQPAGSRHPVGASTGVSELARCLPPGGLCR
jgi:hypothetical protein